jgi:uncharacterized protein (TIGR03086 family)
VWRSTPWGTAGEWFRHLLDQAVVVPGPRGEVLAGPLVEQEGILYAELDVARARAARMEFDPVGHYARPDVFRLVVDTRQQVTTQQEPAADGSPADHTAAAGPRPDQGERVMPADQAELHRRAVEEFGARVKAVGDDQWELPTPCSDWNVRQLVNHLVYENRWTVPLIGGSTIAEVGDRYEGDLLGDRPKAAWDESSEEAVRAVQADGALDRIVDLSSGPTPAREYVSQLFADHLIHAWDLARAIGADDRLDPELVAACAAWFASMEDLYRSIGAIGDRPDVPPAADAQTALLAAFGRTG